jgi:hypothetical protein
MALWHEEKPHENDFTLADVGRARVFRIRPYNRREKFVPRDMIR